MQNTIKCRDAESVANTAAALTVKGIAFTAEEHMDGTFLITITGY